jgi:hypothetical protein
MRKQSHGWQRSDQHTSRLPAAARSDLHCPGRRGRRFKSCHPDAAMRGHRVRRLSPPHDDPAVISPGDPRNPRCGFAAGRGRYFTDAGRGVFSPPYNAGGFHRPACRARRLGGAARGTGVAAATRGHFKRTCQAAAEMGHFFSPALSGGGLAGAGRMRTCWPSLRRPRDVHQHDDRYYRKPTMTTIGPNWASRLQSLNHAQY